MKKLTALLLLLTFSFSVNAENRIISAGSSITELILALGAKEQLVGIDITSRHLDKNEEFPQVGYHRQLSTEGLLALNPTHLIGSEVMGPEKTLTLLQQAQVEVVKVPSGDRMQDLFARIDTLANITDTQKQASILKESLEQKIENMSHRAVDNPPKALFMMINEGRPLTIAGNNTTVDVVIDYAGAVNPAKPLIESYKPLSIEAIIELQPDYILVSQRTWDSLGGQQGILTKYPLLAATPASQTDHIIAIEGSAIIGGFGIESISLSEQLYKQLNPAKK